MWFNFDGILGFFLIIGLVIGLCVATPMYFVGKHYGKQEVYKEAEQHQVLDIRYNEKSGVKEYIWKIISKETT